MMSDKLEFDSELVTIYPRSTKKITLGVSSYNIDTNEEGECKAVTTHISPHGLEFQIPKDYPEGTLLKISINLHRLHFPT